MSTLNQRSHFVFEIIVPETTKWLTDLSRARVFVCDTDFKTLIYALGKMALNDSWLGRWWVNRLCRSDEFWGVVCRLIGSLFVLYTHRPLQFLVSAEQNGLWPTNEPFSFKQNHIIRRLLKLLRSTTKDGEWCIYFRLCRLTIDVIDRWQSRSVERLTDGSGCKGFD